MNRIKISTVIVIVCILIIGLYAMGEVNYFSSKIAVEKNIDAPVVVIPSIGVEEKINNISLAQGVLLDESSSMPPEGSVLLFGHRTLQGSPFLRLNELNVGDSIVLEWPGIGELTYKVIDSKIVPATYRIQTSEGESNIYLITCDPIGSTENRLIVEGELESQGPINDKIIQNNPQEANAWIITAIFLAVGLVFSYFYPKDNRDYILACVLIVSATLFYCCINPIPSELIYDKIIWLNGGI